MNKYFFILGKAPTLSIAEIVSIFDSRRINYSIQSLSDEVAVISTNKEANAEIFMRVLGGTIKLGKVINEISLDDDESEFYEIFSAGNLTDNFLPKADGKLHIGISIYNSGENFKYVAQLTKQLKDLNILAKENLKEKGIRAGFVRIKDRFLSSVSVAKNQLISKGTEIVLIITNEKVMAGKTLAVQEFGSFSFRDYGRPARDKRSGIMPPKLARMMINLAQIDSSATIHDPFCGSGTILQEAIILDYKNIIGSDKSTRAVADTEKNINWLFTNFRQLDKSSYNIKVVQADVRSIGKYFPRNSIDAIITEPYLGPPLYRKPDVSLVERILSEVKRVYLDAFGQFLEILKPGGRVVIVFPAFEEGKKIHFLQILDKIKALGFNQRDYFAEKVKSYPAIQLTSRNTILYGDKYHLVKREILSFQKTK